MQILKLKDVIKVTGLSKSSIYSYISKNKFPKPFHLSERRIGFVETEIITWIEERANKRGGQNV